MFYKTLLIVFLTIIVLLLSTWFFWYRPKFAASKNNFHVTMVKRHSELFIKLQSKAKDLNRLAKIKNCNPDICFLIDMGLESGKNRFFVYDIKNDSILLAGLVAHGSCDGGFKTSASFSNRMNSGCSSLGKYKIGEAYYGRFGKSFKLFGLDTTNNNAFKRSVVLHSYECVPEQETYPVPICNSRGCPMVSPGFMNQIRPIISSSAKPILLWVFD